MADPGFERQCITWIYMVRTYLTRACSDKRNCRKSNCDRYHQPGEKRRNPIGAGDRIMYETNYDKRNPKETECLNLNERLYHPRLYKARPCNNGDNCPLGAKFCAYRHEGESYEVTRECRRRLGIDDAASARGGNNAGAIDVAGSGVTSSGKPIRDTDYSEEVLDAEQDWWNLVREYQVYVCDDAAEHDYSLCFDNHFEDALRRPVINEDGDGLLYDVPQHASNERFFHPWILWKKLCKNQNCSRQYCGYAHGKVEWEGAKLGRKRLLHAIRQRERGETAAAGGGRPSSNSQSNNNNNNNNNNNSHSNNQPGAGGGGRSVAPAPAKVAPWAGGGIASGDGSDSEDDGHVSDDDFEYTQYEAIMASNLARLGTGLGNGTNLGASRMSGGGSGGSGGGGNGGGLSAPSAPYDRFGDMNAVGGAVGSGVNGGAGSFGPPPGAFSSVPVGGVGRGAGGGFDSGFGRGAGGGFGSYGQPQQASQPSYGGDSTNSGSFGPPPGAFSAVPGGTIGGSSGGNGVAPGMGRGVGRGAGLGVNGGMYGVASGGAPRGRQDDFRQNAQGQMFGPGRGGGGGGGGFGPPAAAYGAIGGTPQQQQQQQQHGAYQPSAMMSGGGFGDSAVGARYMSSIDSLLGDDAYADPQFGGNGAVGNDHSHTAGAFNFPNPNGGNGGNGGGNGGDGAEYDPSIFYNALGTQQPTPAPAATRSANNAFGPPPGVLGGMGRGAGPASGGGYGGHTSASAGATGGFGPPQAAFQQQQQAEAERARRQQAEEAKRRQAEQQQQFQRMQEQRRLQQQQQEAQQEATAAAAAAAEAAASSSADFASRPGSTSAGPRGSEAFEQACKRWMYTAKNFQVRECRDGEACDNPMCFDWHKQSEERRPPLDSHGRLLYSGDFRASSRDPTQCISVVERVYHPYSFKTLPCNRGNRCTRGAAFCAFLHPEDDEDVTAACRERLGYTDHRLEAPRVDESQPAVGDHGAKAAESGGAGKKKPKKRKKKKTKNDGNDRPRTAADVVAAAAAASAAEDQSHARRPAPEPRTAPPPINRDQDPYYYEDDTYLNDDEYAAELAEEEAFWWRLVKGFQVRPCKNKKYHDHHACFYNHFSEKKRRPVIGSSPSGPTLLYQTPKQRGNERYFHPWVLWKRECEDADCTREFCGYAHGSIQLEAGENARRQLRQELKAAASGSKKGGGKKGGNSGGNGKHGGSSGETNASGNSKKGKAKAGKAKQQGKANDGGGGGGGGGGEGASTQTSGGGNNDGSQQGGRHGGGGSNNGGEAGGADSNSDGFHHNLPSNPHMPPGAKYAKLEEGSPEFDRACSDWFRIVRRYHIQQCPYETQEKCGDRDCLNWHKPSEQRRKALDRDDQVLYQGVFNKDHPNRSECLTLVELLYHPSCYKKQYCTRGNSCPLRFRRCAFLHEQDDPNVSRVCRERLGLNHRPQGHASGPRVRDADYPDHILDLEAEWRLLVERYHVDMCRNPQAHDYQGCFDSHRADLCRRPVIGPGPVLNYDVPDEAHKERHFHPWILWRAICKYPNCKLKYCGYAHSQSHIKAAALGRQRLTEEISDFEAGRGSGSRLYGNTDAAPATSTAAGAEDFGSEYSYGDDDDGGGAGDAYANDRPSQAARVAPPERPRTAITGGAYALLGSDDGSYDYDYDSDDDNGRTGPRPRVLNR